MRVANIHMSLWTTTLLSTWLVLAVRGTSTGGRPESVSTVKALAMTLLTTATSALALTNTAHTDAGCTILCPHILRIRLVWRFGRTTTSTLSKCLRRRGVATLTESHKTLDTLVAVQLWVFVIPSQATLGVVLLMLVQFVIWLVLMLVAVRSAGIVILLYPSLLARTSALSRRWLVHGRIFDEGLWNTIGRIVGRAVILVLSIWVVVGLHRRRWVRLLGTLSSRWLRCDRALWWQLSRLGGRWKHADSG